MSSCPDVLGNPNDTLCRPYAYNYEQPDFGTCYPFQGYSPISTSCTKVDQCIP